MTLLEALLSSVILCTVLLSVLFCFTGAQRHFTYAKEIAELEAEARGLFSYMETEMRQCKRFERVGDKLFLTHLSGMNITYQKVGEQIIRRVNMEGYIIIGRYVRVFQVEAEAGGCRFYVELKKGKATWRGSRFLGKRVELAEAK